MWYFHYLRRIHERDKRLAVAATAFNAKLKELDSNSLCIDCGANVGIYTVMMAETGAQVHAFEPDPNAFEALCANTNQYKNIYLYNVAVGVEAKKTKLFLSKKHDEDPLRRSVSSSTLNSSYRVSQKDYVEVHQINFLDFIRKQKQQVSLTKMDIEGAEVELLSAVISAGLFNRLGETFVETHEKQIKKLRRETMNLIEMCHHMGISNVNFDWH